MTGDMRLERILILANYWLNLANEIDGSFEEKKLYLKKLAKVGHPHYGAHPCCGADWTLAT